MHGLEGPMAVDQACCESVDSGAGWGTVGGKGKPIPRICIISTKHEALPFPVWEGSGIISLLPSGLLMRRMESS